MILSESLARRCKIYGGEKRGYILHLLLWLFVFAFSKYCISVCSCLRLSAQHVNRPCLFLFPGVFLLLFMDLWSLIHITLSIYLQDD